MDVQSKIGVVQAVQQPAPPPPQPDGRASADVAATKTDPTPEVPLPAPVSGSQTGLVSKASLTDKDTDTKIGTSAVAPAERVLKPYGVNMLPEKTDTSKQDTPDETAQGPVED